MICDQTALGLNPDWLLVAAWPWMWPWLLQGSLPPCLCNRRKPTACLLLVDSVRQQQKTCSPLPAQRKPLGAVVMTIASRKIQPVDASQTRTLLGQEGGTASHQPGAGGLSFQEMCVNESDLLFCKEKHTYRLLTLACCFQLVHAFPRLPFPLLCTVGQMKEGEHRSGSPACPRCHLTVSSEDKWPWPSLVVSHWLS